jgi:type III secretion protein S
VTQDLIYAHTNDALMTVLLLSGPVLLVAVVVGLIIGLIQAVMQIQDQTLPQTVKLMTVLVVIILFGGMMGTYLSQQAIGIMNDFPRITR